MTHITEQHCTEGASETPTMYWQFSSPSVLGGWLAQWYWLQQGAVSLDEHFTLRDGNRTILFLEIDKELDGLVELLTALQARRDQVRKQFTSEAPTNG